MEQLLFLTPGCTFAAVITLFPSIILHKQTKTDISVFATLLLFSSLPLLSASPPLCVLTILPMDPTSIHLGLLSPQSDNRLYLDVLFLV